jgi:uncharacterized membrane protein YhiD involved in acid resistance
MADTKVLNLYVEFEKLIYIGKFIEYIKERDIKVNDLEITRSNSADEVEIAVLLTIRLPKKQAHASIVSLLNGAEGVNYIEEV